LKKYKPYKISFAIFFGSDISKTKAFISFVISLYQLKEGKNFFKFLLKSFNQIPSINSKGDF